MQIFRQENSLNVLIFNDFHRVVTWRVRKLFCYKPIVLKPYVRSTLLAELLQLARQSILMLHSHSHCS